MALPPRFFVSRGAAAATAAVATIQHSGHAMCEDCMGRLAASEGQTLTRSRRRVVIRCPLRCDASTERVLA